MRQALRNSWRRDCLKSVLKDCFSFARDYTRVEHLNRLWPVTCTGCFANGF